MTTSSPMGDALIREHEYCDYARSVQASACMEMAGEFIERAITAGNETSRAFWIGMSRGCRRYALSLMGLETRDYPRTHSGTSPEQISDGSPGGVRKHE